MTRRPSFALLPRRSVEADAPSAAAPACVVPAPEHIAHADAPQLEKLLRLEQVMELLDISERTVRRYVAKGLLPAVKLDGSLRFRPSDVVEFIQRSLRKT